MIFARPQANASYCGWLLPISCFGKVLVTHLCESQPLPKCDTDRGHTWSEATQTFLDISNFLKLWGLYRRSRTTSHTVTVGTTSMCTPGTLWANSMDRGHTWSEATYIIEGPNNGTVVVVVAPGCMKAKATARTTAKIIRKTSKAGLLLRPQPTVKKTPRNTPKARNIISR